MGTNYKYQLLVTKKRERSIGFLRNLTNGTTFHYFLISWSFTLKYLTNNHYPDECSRRSSGEARRATQNRPLTGASDSGSPSRVNVEPLSYRGEDLDRVRNLSSSDMPFEDVYADIFTQNLRRHTRTPDW